ncbi:MAG TPA: sugar phosphate isomerase/epimerase family protein [Amycolatopsis sp.]|uniref:sugar phosphate isomerase/epimerase family protein n=1 Tax=Amycolatopsis sp. TaxID=37632 RepID=UPI002B47F77B|nr:sugar phosphate isomerase/epimerase family protein [Amycolatopsis sp.]HKS50207.1 sugar phosphate isomerase/epimerase family protein [Amycolatopsis sp.]
MPWTLRYTTHLGYAPPEFRPQFRETLGTTDPAAHIRYAAEIGMAGVFYPWALGRPPAEIRLVRDVLAETGLSAGGVVCVPFAEFTGPIWTDRSIGGRKRLEAHVLQAAELAASLGSGVLAALIAVDPDRPDDQRQRDDVAANLRDLGRVVADYDLTLAVEPMVRLPNMMMRTTAEAVRLITAADHPNLGIIYDTAHVAMMDGDLVGALRAAWDHIALIQIADLPGRVEPGAGELAIVDVLAEATRSGYTGLVDLEHGWLSPTRDGEQAGLARIRRFDDLVHSAL